MQSQRKGDEAGRKIVSHALIYDTAATNQYTTYIQGISFHISWYLTAGFNVGVITTFSPTGTIEWCPTHDRQNRIFLAGYSENGLGRTVSVTLRKWIAKNCDIGWWEDLLISLIKHFNFNWMIFILKIQLASSRFAKARFWCWRSWRRTNKMKNLVQVPVSTADGWHICISNCIISIEAQKKEMKWIDTYNSVI